MKIIFISAALLVGPALGAAAQPLPPPLSASEMIGAAYAKLAREPGVVDDAFWQAERWYAPRFVAWITRNKGCQGAAEIWHSGEATPAISQVAVQEGTELVGIYDVRVVVVRFRNHGQPEERRFYMQDRWRGKRPGDGWRIAYVATLPPDDTEAEPAWWGLDDRCVINERGSP